MKNYWLFGYAHYYPHGGMHDFINNFDTFDEALKVAYEGSLDINWIAGCGGDFPYYQILDIRNPRRVFFTRSNTQRAEDAAWILEHKYPADYYKDGWYLRDKDGGWVRESKS